MDVRKHWEQIYSTRRATEVSWYQQDPQISLSFIRHAVPDTGSVIADVGGGASTLVDGLLQAGYRNPIVLDLSAAAIAQARERLGPSAGRVVWIEADALSDALPRSGIDLWHDRAVFHFLAKPEDRAMYCRQARRALRPGGHLVMATFAEDGPRRCSGLDVVRYSEESLQTQLGSDFELVDHKHEVHITPAGAHQAFLYCLFRHTPTTEKMAGG